jgi:hypothetical protein
MGLIITSPCGSRKLAFRTMVKVNDHHFFGVNQKLNLDERKHEPVIFHIIGFQAYV